MQLSEMLALPPGEDPFGVIIGADIMYDRGLLPALLHTLQGHLAPGGCFYCVDPGRLDSRSVRKSFVSLLRRANPEWEYEEQAMETCTQAARTLCAYPDSLLAGPVHIHLHEQRLRGLAIALGLPEASLGESVSVDQLVQADEPYMLLTVRRPIVENRPCALTAVQCKAKQTVI